jgi:hypothetical protein
MTTHVFIVDSNTFKYHLEYMFAWTWAWDKYIDFNNSDITNLHYASENWLLWMIADWNRVRINDLIIFYLQQNSSNWIREWKFFWVFKVTERLFLDNNDENQFLWNELWKSLTFRIKISPHHVYEKGITEWEALDEIKNIQAPGQMLWSLIYRKLKANRWNTMLTLYESDRLINLIRNKNQRNTLEWNNFSFNVDEEKIIATENNLEYTWWSENINILPRLIKKFNRNNQFETHLQAYILNNIENLDFLNNQNIEWIWNEVSCWVGMQRIDIMLSVLWENRKVLPIELKSTEAYVNIKFQIQRYVDWIEQYYISNYPSDIEPIIISRKIINKDSEKYTDLINMFNEFNSINNTLPLKYIEFEIIENNIFFTEINYQINDN